MKTQNTKRFNVNIVVGISLNCLVLASCLARQPMQNHQRLNHRTFTDQQKVWVKNILSKYKASSLTKDEVQTIHRAFRDAGLPGGSALNQALQEAGFDPDVLRELDPPQHMQRQRPEHPYQRNQNHTRRGQRQKIYSIEQALSEQAQLHTIAYNGLAFLTGDFGTSTFIPPGKVCDFFGFQYMRDIDAAQMGHNPMFLNRVAGNVMHVLNDEQKQLFLALAERQAPKLEKLARMRLPLIKAFHLQRDDDIHSDSQGLNKNAVVKYVGEIFAFDAELSHERAEVMSQVFLSLSSEQKARFNRMRFGDFNTWPDIDERGQLKRMDPIQPKLVRVAYMTYASEFFSWTAGSLTADTYFCPERHGTYFGGFYMKDIPAMDKRDYNISTTITGNHGQAFLYDILTPLQRSLVLELPDKQRILIQNTVTVRKAIALELRKLLEGKIPDKSRIVNLGRQYGELDGAMSWEYATVFAKLNQTLTRHQRSSLNQLRNLEGYKSAPYYIYSEPVYGQLKYYDVKHFFMEPASNDLGV